MPRLEPKPKSDAAGQLKAAACRLFAERGVDGVTVREIAEEAGQKNHAAVGYYFGSKEALIRDLILDGAALIDERRNRWLDDLEEVGGPSTIREVVDILIRSSIELAGPGREDCYNRFIVMLGMTHREFFMQTLGGLWNSGYLRCLDHFRRLMPDLPLATKNQRLIFMGVLLGGVLAAREGELAGRAHPTWTAPKTLDHLALSMTALLQAA